MEKTEKGLDTAQELTREIKNELAGSLELLDERLDRLQRNLDLGCSNLRDLVASKDPAICDQLDVLNESIKDLGSSLSEVRQSLASARGGTQELHETLPEGESEKGLLGGGSNEGDVDPETAQRCKHDKPVTLGGVLRALFMADEPGQQQ